MTVIDRALVPAPMPEPPRLAEGEGAAVWVRRNLFRSPLDGVITIVSAAVVGYVLFRLGPFRVRDRSLGDRARQPQPVHGRPLSELGTVAGRGVHAQPRVPPRDRGRERPAAAAAGDRSARAAIDRSSGTRRDPPDLATGARRRAAAVDDDDRPADRVRRRHHRRVRSSDGCSPIGWPTATSSGSCSSRRCSSACWCGCPNGTAKVVVVIGVAVAAVAGALMFANPPAAVVIAARRCRDRPRAGQLVGPRSHRLGSRDVARHRGRRRHRCGDRAGAGDPGIGAVLAGDLRDPVVRRQPSGCSPARSGGTAGAA